jgi:predicted GTPase
VSFGHEGGDKQIAELEEMIHKAEEDLVDIDTLIDLSRVMKIDKSGQCLRYDLQIIGKPTLKDLLEERFPVRS